MMDRLKIQAITFSKLRMAIETTNICGHWEISPL